MEAKQSHKRGMLGRTPIGLVRGGWLILAGLLPVAFVLLLEVRSWPYELLHHFLLHYVIVSCSLAILFLSLGRKAPAVGAAVLSLILIAKLWSASPTGGKPQNLSSAVDDGRSPPRSLTVITHNVRDTNKRHGDLRRWLHAHPADVILLQEVPAREAALYREESVFAHQREVVDPRLNHPKFPDDKTLVVLSSYALSAEAAFKPASGSRPVAIVRVSIPDAEDPWFVAVDAWDPKTPANLAKRDRLLLSIAPRIAELPGPVVVAGDLNATPYTPVFDDFLQLARLSPASSPVATYPSFLGWLGVPIDHILVRGVQVREVEALSSIGSDHRPLKATLLLTD